MKTLKWFSLEYDEDNSALPINILAIGDWGYPAFFQAVENEEKAFDWLENNKFILSL